MSMSVAVSASLPVRELDGPLYRRLTVAGSQNVLAHREAINRINVFPVADADTGTNMAHTLKAVARVLSEGPAGDLSGVARAASEACVLGARGNSGLILSHFFTALARAIDDRERLDPDELASALIVAADALYEAVDPPVEGTILTVAREATRAAASRGHSDLVTLFEALVKAARVSLTETTARLDVLRRAGVVDAGAKGFVLLLEGMLRELKGQPMARVEVARRAPGPRVHTQDLSSGYRYCTEAVLRVRAGLEPARLKEAVASLGDCVIPLVSGTLGRVHIHTDLPGEVFSRLSSSGTLIKKKVEDMREQSRAFLEAPAEGTVRLFCDSTADLPLELMETLGVGVVPLHVRFGEEDLRDKFDLLPDEFYHRLAGSPVHPTTSQPSPEEFAAVLRPILPTLGPDERAVGILISSKLSGTYQSAAAAARNLGGPVDLFDSGLVSAPLGLLVFRASRWVREGLSPAEVLRRLAVARPRTNCLFMVDTLEYLRKGGRISWSKAILGGLLGLRPILTFQEGAIAPVTRVRGAQAARRTMLDLLAERVPAGSRVHLTLAHTGRPDELADIEEELRRRYDPASFHVTPMGPVVGVHVGPGAWGVAWSIEDGTGAADPRKA